MNKSTVRERAERTWTKMQTFYMENGAVSLLWDSAMMRPKEFDVLCLVQCLANMKAPDKETVEAALELPRGMDHFDIILSAAKQCLDRAEATDIGDASIDYSNIAEICLLCLMHYGKWSDAAETEDARVEQLYRRDMAMFEDIVAYRLHFPSKLDDLAKELMWAGVFYHHHQKICAALGKARLNDVLMTIAKSHTTNDQDVAAEAIRNMSNISEAHAEEIFLIADQTEMPTLAWAALAKILEKKS